MPTYEKVKASTITIDTMRWQWNVRRGSGLAIFGREDLPDGRIRFLLGDGQDILVQPTDRIWATRHVHGHLDHTGRWVVPVV